MTKIIVALDGLKFSDAASKYAAWIAKCNDGHLVGVFLDDFTYTSYKIHDLVATGVSERELKQYSAKDKKTRDNAVSAFEQICGNEGISYSIRHDRNIAVRELLNESIYADLLVIDTRETFTHYEAKAPTRFIQDLLSNVKCPVLLVPQHFTAFEKSLFLYNGEPSSVYAIKMFSAILPSLAALPAEVISAKGFYGDLHVPDSRLIKEFIKRHYSKVVFTVLKGQAEEEIAAHLKKENANAVIVSGAYSRSRASRFFKHSMADLLMQEMKFPIFIAHNK